MSNYYDSERLISDMCPCFFVLKFQTFGWVMDTKMSNIKKTKRYKKEWSYFQFGENKKKEGSYFVVAVSMIQFKCVHSKNGS